MPTIVAEKAAPAAAARVQGDRIAGGDQWWPDRRYIGGQAVEMRPMPRRERPAVDSRRRLDDMYGRKIPHGPGDGEHTYYFQGREGDCVIGPVCFVQFDLLFQSRRSSSRSPARTTNSECPQPGVRVAAEQKTSLSNASRLGWV